LDDTRSISCDPWPVGENELDTENLTVLKSGKHVGFLAESKLRDGSKIFQYQAFLGDTDLALSAMKSLSFGGDSVALEGELLQQGASLAVVHNRGAPEVTLKMHGIDTNVVGSESSNLAGKVQGGAILSSENGYWLLMRRGPYQVAYVGQKPVKGIMPVQLFPKVSTNSRPTLLLDSDKNSTFLLDLDRKPKRDSQVQGAFSLTRLTTDGEASAPQILAISAPGGVETWAATTRPGGFDLAIIEGDSLIGQASLNITSMKVSSAGPRLDWNKSISLKNMHIAQPFWVSSPSRRWIMMLKWIDGESTLAAYKIGNSGVESTTHFGVFPKGTALVSAFYSGVSSELIAVIRNKVGYRWNYEICSLGSAD
jgi:hypothetical protein